MLPIILLLNFLIWTSFLYFYTGKYLPDSGRIMNAVISVNISLAIFGMVYFLFLIFSLYFWIFLSFQSTCSVIIIYRNFSTLIRRFNCRFLLSAIGIKLLLMLVSILVITIMFVESSKKYGDWDAWAIWNLRAKFLLSEDVWKNSLHPGLFWSHPDYPLMLPSWIAIIWKSIGFPSFIVPMLLAYFIMLNILLVLYSSVRIVCGELYGIIILVFLPLDFFFVAQSATQYADTLLALFILITFILFNQNKNPSGFSYFLLGFFSASTGWIKNEGLLFFLVFSIFLLIRSRKERTFYISYMYGAIVPLLIIIIFKLFYAPPNDLLQNQTVHVVFRNLNMTRLSITGNYLLKIIFSEFPILLPLLFLVVIFNPGYFFSFNGLIIFIILFAYMLIYLCFARELEWLLKTSFDRLIHQYYLSFIYTSMISMCKLPPFCQPIGKIS